MRRYLLSLSSVLMIALLLSQATVAQDKNDKDKEKNKEKYEKDKKDKLSSDEIVIRRKTDKDTKVTIEIKGDDVLVNGKPVDEYSDDDVSIRKRKGITIVTPRSPFRGQSGNGGNWSYSDNNDLFQSREEKIAFLGVVTEKAENGAKIEEVTDGSAAEKAGLKEGDVIVKIDEIKVEDQDDVTKAIRKHKPEEKAVVTIKRDGKESQVTATLGSRKSDVYAFNAPNIKWNEGQFGQSFAFGGRARLGIKAQDTEEGKGVKVLEVDEESAADKAGIKEDDIITEFDGQKVNSAEELSKAAKDSKDKSSVKVVITRDGKTQNLEIKTPRKLKTTNL